MIELNGLTKQTGPVAPDCARQMNNEDPSDY